jgi:hypothetical protein
VITTFYGKNGRNMITTFMVQLGVSDAKNKPKCFRDSTGEKEEKIGFHLASITDMRWVSSVASCTSCI